MAVRRFALVFGAVCVLIGLIGFALTGFGDFAASEGRIALNQAGNGLHLVSGLAGLSFGLVGRRATAAA